MADETGHISKTLDDIKAQIAAKLSEAARLLPTANLLAEMIGAPSLSLSDFIVDHEELGAVVTPAAGPSDRQQPSLVRGGSARHIKPDTFLGQPPLDAAKKYLGMVGHAVNIDEVTSAVERGGAAVKGADWRDKLEMGLLRSTHDVVKVQEKTYGLVAFYTPAQIEGLRGVRRRDKPKPKRSAKPREKATKPTKGTTPGASPKATKDQANEAKKATTADSGAALTPEQVH